MDTLRTELTDALQALKDADAAIPTTTRGLEAAEESYRVRTLLFQNSRATNVELTDAETDVLRARLDAVHARIDQRIARVRLEYAMGR